MTTSTHGLRRAVLVLISASVLLMPAFAGRARSVPGDDAEPGLREIAFLPSIVTSQASSFGLLPPPMIVDQTNNMGFAIGRDADNPSTDPKIYLRMYDLRDLRPLKGTDQELNVAGTAESDTILTWAIDEKRERIFASPRPSPGVPTSQNDFVCVSTTGRVLTVYSYGEASGTEHRILEARTIKIPCYGTSGVLPLTVSVDAASDKLYILGTQPIEKVKNLSPVNILGIYDNDGSPLILRQIDMAKLDLAQTDPGKLPDALDWDVDLRYAGCGQRDLDSYLIKKAGANVLSYCADTSAGRFRTSVAGEQRHVVRIPLDEHDMPLRRGTEGLGLPPVEAPGAGPADEAVAPAMTAVPTTTTSSTTTTTTPALRDPTNPANDKFVADAVVYRMPALSGKAAPFADPESVAVLLLTSDALNGNAVWVHDPLQERFVGVVTGGAVDQPPNRTAFGFDEQRGRAYLLLKDGVLSTSIRQRPLPGGNVHAVVNHPGDVLPELNTTNYSGYVRSIAMAPALGRLFVPIANRSDPERQGYAVLQDDTPDPEPVPVFDPDSLTNQVPEAEGKTQSNASGSALASGLHVIVAGGFSRIVNELDPFCSSVWPGFLDATAWERDQLNGQCIGEKVLASGHREWSLAQSALSASLERTAEADATGFGVGADDTATNRDVSSLGECAESRLQPPPEEGSTTTTMATTTTTTPYSAFCHELHSRAEEIGVPNPEGGTSGTDGRGYPAPGAHCFDSGEEPKTDRQPEDGRFERTWFDALAACEAKANRAETSALSAGVSFTDATGTPIVVAGTASSATTERTEEGQVTVVEATARGIEVGPLRIGEVRSRAETRAKGNAGTAHSALQREWCDVLFDGASLFDQKCIDPTTPEHREQIDLINQALGRIRVSVPEAEIQATDGGYQAVVTKDPDVRAGDQTVNDDDSHTVSALQVVFYNDGTEGRSRVMLQLAGVHAEARYGIFELPFFESLSFSSSSSFTPGTPLTRRAIPGRRTLPGAPTLIEGESFESLLAGDTALATPQNPVRGFFQMVPEAVADLLRLLIQHPLEFALLFGVLSLLAAPAYLAHRRRQFAAMLAYNWATTRASVVDLRDAAHGRAGPQEAIARGARALASLSAATLERVAQSGRRARRLHKVEEAAGRRAVAAEREQMAYDLHDTVGQVFVTIKLLAHDHAEHLPVDSPERERALRISRLAGHGKADVDHASRGLSLAPAGHHGLVSSLRALAEDFGSDSGVGVEVRSAGRAGRIDPRQEGALYRVAHEALANAWRHAGAKFVSVEIRFGPDEIVLSVTDDGVGFGDRRPMEGVGITSMRRVLGEVGGALTLGNAKPAGAALEARVPRKAR